MKDLFGLITGAEFSKCRNYRYALWRIWDQSLPLVMFIGLNPSKANEDEPDNTIKAVTAIATNLGYGGFYMMNCFPFVSTNPEDLIVNNDNTLNDSWLYNVRKSCRDVIFAWGIFKVVKKTGRDKQLMQMFPDALALRICKDGSPQHPLYIKRSVKPISYKQNKQHEKY